MKKRKRKKTEDEFLETYFTFGFQDQITGIRPDIKFSNRLLSDMQPTRNSVSSQMLDSVSGCCRISGRPDSQHQGKISLAECPAESTSGRSLLNPLKHGRFSDPFSKCSERGVKLNFLIFFFIGATATKRLARSKIFRYGCLKGFNSAIAIGEGGWGKLPRVKIHPPPR